MLEATREAIDGKPHERLSAEAGLDLLDLVLRGQKRLVLLRNARGRPRGFEEQTGACFHSGEIYHGACHFGD